MPGDDHNCESEVEGSVPDWPESSAVWPEAVYASPANIRLFLRHAKEVERTAGVPMHADTPKPLPEHPHDLDCAIVEEGRHSSLAALLHETATDGIVVISRGTVAYQRCFRGFTPHRYHSITKSVASCVATNLVDDGLLWPDRLVARCVSGLAGSAYSDARVRDLVDMKVGIRHTLPVPRHVRPDGVHRS